MLHKDPNVLDVQYLLLVYDCSTILDLDNRKHNPPSQILLNSDYREGPFSVWVGSKLFINKQMIIKWTFPLLARVRKMCLGRKLLNNNTRNKDLYISKRLSFTRIYIERVLIKGIPHVQMQKEVKISVLFTWVFHERKRIFQFTLRIEINSVENSQ